MNCSEKLALQALKSSDWHLEGAFDVFYSQPQVKSYADTRLLEELFKRYKGKRCNSVGFCSPHPLVKSLCVCFVCMMVSLGLVILLLRYAHCNELASLSDSIVCR